ncbi:MAG: sigma 54-interacting transcriptional regulator [Candidatus Edwardsbacteria bacterium]|nr:sigma 54-interacting transcriptional regulator [Candidatus Edwardsbacteria bacterium]
MQAGDAERLFLIWSRLADVLGHLHQRKIIHGDLKPEHVLIDGDRVKLIDLGIARQAQARSGFGFQGTAAYAAPELLSGQAEATMRSDIYSLGLVIRSALGLPMPSVEQKLDPDNAWSAMDDGLIGPRAAEVLRRMLNHAPETRYATAGHLAEALQSAGAYRPDRQHPAFPFINRSAELKEALSLTAGKACSLIAVSGEPGAGKTRFLQELNFLFQVNGRAGVLFTNSSKIEVDWSKTPGGVIVLLDHAGSDGAMELKAALPKGARLFCALDPNAEASLREPHRTVTLRPLRPDDLQQLAGRFLHKAHPRDTAALARHLGILSAGNIGVVKEYVDRYLEKQHIVISHGQWQFKWQELLKDAGIPKELETELADRWNDGTEQEKRCLQRACVAGQLSAMPRGSGARWSAYGGFIGATDRKTAGLAEVLRRFVVAQMTDDEIRAYVKDEPSGNDPAPDRIRWELLARLGMWPEWVKAGQALLRAGEERKDAESIIFFGRALLESGKLSDSEVYPIAKQLLRMYKEMGRTNEFEEIWRLAAIKKELGWAPAFETAQYFATLGQKTLAKEALERSFKAAHSDDGIIQQRLDACRIWIDYDPAATAEYPPELRKLAAEPTAGADSVILAAETNDYLARIAYQKKDWKNLEKFASAAVRSYEKADDKTQLGLSYWFLGYGFLKNGKTVETEKVLQKCLQILDDGLPNDMLASVWQHLALVKIGQRQWNEAEQCLIKAEYNLPLPVPEATRAYLLATRGVIYSGQGHHALVKDSQLEAAGLYLDAGDHSNYAICLANAALEEHLMGNATMTDSMLARALEHSRKHSADHAQVIVLKDLCQAALELNHNDEAWEYFESGRTLAERKKLRLTPDHLAHGALAAVMLGKAQEAAQSLGRLAGKTDSEIQKIWHDLACGEKKIRLEKEEAGLALMIESSDRFLAQGMELEAANAWMRAGAAVMDCKPAASADVLIPCLVRAESIYERHRAGLHLGRVRELLLRAARQFRKDGIAATDPVLLDGLYKLTELLSTVEDPNQIAEAAVRLAVNLIDAERGGLFLLDEQSNLSLVAQVNLDPDTRRDALEFSRDAVLAAAGAGREVVSNDAQMDLEFKSRLSVQRNAIRSLLAAPVCFREGAIGALYLDSRLKSGVFSAQRRSFLKALASIIGAALESGRLMSRLRQENKELKGSQPSALDQIVGKSPAIRQLLGKIRTAAATDARVLMEGETGTGKELAARAIHELSGRSGNTFLALDCGSLPENLLEAELFGYAKGAFTGAYADKNGLFEAADGGTLFLDEINSASPAVQSRLLRATDTGEIRRVGDTKARTVDVRLICAANQDLEVKINQGRFKEDLYYRLKVVHLVIPPLRARAGDILILAEYYRQRVQRQLKKRGMRFTDAARERLLRYAWPGNIRELEHVVKRAVIMAPGVWIEPEDLDIHEEEYPAQPMRHEVDQAKRGKVVDALRMSNSNATKAAGILGVSRRQIQRLIKKYKLR